MYIFLAKFLKHLVVMEYSSESDYSETWVDWFLGTKGNEYFCDIELSYILDRFNLTGLNVEVQYFQAALDLITGSFDQDCDEEMREIIDKSARHLYGLIHARYIITNEGLRKMIDKYKKLDFGSCPRVFCRNQALLPVALTDIPRSKSVKLFCPHCEDIYSPKSSRHTSLDGAYFGTSFPHMIFQVYPSLLPKKSVEMYQPRMFGFKTAVYAKLGNWREEERKREFGLRN